MAKRYKRLKRIKRANHGSRPLCRKKGLRPRGTGKKD